MKTNHIDLVVYRYFAPTADKFDRTEVVYKSGKTATFRFGDEPATIRAFVRSERTRHTEALPDEEGEILASIHYR